MQHAPRTAPLVTITHLNSESLEDHILRLPRSAYPGFLVTARTVALNRQLHSNHRNAARPDA